MQYHQYPEETELYIATPTGGEMLGVSFFVLWGYQGLEGAEQAETEPSKAAILVAHLVCLMTLMLFL